ncbi:hypothetical protein ACFP1Z_27950 [Streptomyces gamaensis]|uniref:BsuBI/PstI restriction endonuclease HTH domain-containing protein n=1 Tax=Streptomyces gamaensis TaxID=1763542 RepID=A0ABW0Z9K2_9ACTN
MGRRPGPLDPSNPLHAFALGLVELRDTAGPAGRVKETCTGAGIGRSTYYAWLGGKQLPGRDALEVAVRFWGGDVGEWMMKRRQTEKLLAEEVKKQTERALLRGSPKFRSGANFGEITSVAIHNPATIHPAQPRGTEKQVNQARGLLRALGFDTEGSNERSAYVLLALLMLGPDTQWHNAGQPILRVPEIMQWIRDIYKKEYAPNTRESIRRFTLKQFIERGIVIQNPDRPDRPINSPKWCYQISQETYQIARGGEWLPDRSADAKEDG